MPPTVIFSGPVFTPAELERSCSRASSISLKATTPARFRTRFSHSSWHVRNEFVDKIRQTASEKSSVFPCVDTSYSHENTKEQNPTDDNAASPPSPAPSSRTSRNFGKAPSVQAVIFTWNANRLASPISYLASSLDKTQNPYI